MDREKVKAGLRNHISLDSDCENCTYDNDGWCMSRLMSDALELIEELEERIAIMEEGGKPDA